MTVDLRTRLQAALGGAYAIERELGGGGMSRVFQIGEELGVQYLLSGTVRWERGSAGRRVRVSPELIRAGAGATAWQESFDAPLTDVFAVNETFLAPHYGWMLENLPFTGLALLEEGRLKDAQRHSDDARRAYRRFVEWYDLPNARLRHLVDEAEASLERLGGTSVPREDGS